MNRQPEPSSLAPEATRDPLGPVPASPRSRRERFPWAYLLIFVVGAALVVSAMWYHLQGQRASIKARWQAELSEISRVRVQLVSNWLEARRADAEVLATSPPVRALLSGKPQRDEAVGRLLNRVVAVYGYSSVVIFDTRGRPVA